jgi:hypothetical protein
MSLKHIITIDEPGYDLSTSQAIHNAASAVNNAMLESRRISDRVSASFEPEPRADSRMTDRGRTDTRPVA